MISLVDLPSLVPYLTAVSVVGMWLSRTMKMRGSFGNSLFVGLELIHVFESLSPGRFKALLLVVNYSSLFIDKRTLFFLQYFQMCTSWEQRSKIKFNFESSWNPMWQVDVSWANPTRALGKTCHKPLLCLFRFSRLMRIA